MIIKTRTKTFILFSPKIHKIYYDIEKQVLEESPEFPLGAETNRSKEMGKPLEKLHEKRM
jgi:hypothetical protein